MLRAEGFPHVKGIPAKCIPESWQRDGALKQVPSVTEASVSPRHAFLSGQLSHISKLVQCVPSAWRDAQTQMHAPDVTTFSGLPEAQHPPHQSFLSSYCVHSTIMCLEALNAGSGRDSSVPLGCSNLPLRLPSLICSPAAARPEVAIRFSCRPGKRLFGTQSCFQPSEKPFCSLNFPKA